MKKATKEIIKASFEANPDLNELHADQHGHCFKAGGEGLTLVKRENFEGELEDDAEDSNDAGGSLEPKAPKDMTVKELTAALADLSIEIPKGAKKEDLVALLVASQGE